MIKTKHTVIESTKLRGLHGWHGSNICVASMGSMGP